jgi:hypothetical protein
MHSASVHLSLRSEFLFETSGSPATSTHPRMYDERIEEMDLEIHMRRFQSISKSIS